MNHIKKARQKKGYTQEQAARLLGISLRHYLNIEFYKSKPNVYLALRLCTILDADPFKLFNPNNLSD